VRQDRCLLALALLCLSALPAAAQEEGSVLRLQPQVAATVGALPDASLADSTQRFGRRDFGASFAVPLTRGWEPGSWDIPPFRLVLHGGVRVAPATLPLAAPDTTLYSLHGGLSGVHIFSQQNQLAWSGEVGFAEDRSTVSHPRPRVLGSVIGLRRRSASLTWLYGGAYSFAFGRGRALPIFGFVWRAAPETTVQVIGPIEGGVRRRLGSRLVIGARAALAGNQFQVSNDGQFPGQPDELQLRVRELRLGVEAGIRVHGRLDLVVDGGVATLRHLGLAPDASSFGRGWKPASEFFSSSVASAPYFTIGLRLILSSSPLATFAP
jgi:hypothetical protein